MKDNAIKKVLVARPLKESEWYRYIVIEEESSKELYLEIFKKDSRISVEVDGFDENINFKEVNFEDLPYVIKKEIYIRFSKVSKRCRDILEELLKEEREQKEIINSKSKLISKDLNVPFEIAVAFNGNLEKTKEFLLQLKVACKKSENTVLKRHYLGSEEGAKFKKMVEELGIFVDKEKVIYLKKYILECLKRRKIV